MCAQKLGHAQCCERASVYATTAPSFFVCAQRTRGKAEGLSAEDAAAAAKRFPDPPRAIRRDKALTDGFAIAVAAADAAAP